MTTTRIVRRSEPASPVPLGLPQETFWTLHCLTRHIGGLAHNIRCDLRINAPIDDDVVAGAIERLARRHESLRTVFRELGGRGFQVTTDAVPRLAVVDLTSEDDPVAASDLVAEAELETKLSLVEAPPWRALLMRLGPSRSRLVLTLHHIVCDGWSLRIMEREIAELIGAAVEGWTPDLPELPVQYGDYACWQDRHVRCGEIQRQMRHLLEVLRSLPLAIALDVAVEAPGGVTTRSFTIDPAITASLASAAAKVRASSFAGLLAAFRVALHAWSGQQDVVLGSAAAGRRHAEVADVVGCFFNTVVVRSAAPTGDFSHVVRETRNMTFDALRHQDVPIDMLLRALWLEEVRRGNSRRPMIEAGLRHEEPAAPFRVDWIEQAPPAPQTRPGPPRIAAYAIARDDGTEVWLDVPERFGGSAADDLAATFRQAVIATALRPHESVATRFSAAAHDLLEFRGLRLDARRLARALVRHPVVDDAFVAVATADEPELVAWVVLSRGTGCPPAAADVRRHLEREGEWWGILPVLCSVPEIPRAGGRVLREDLPDPPAGRPPPPSPPKSADELRLGRIFERVLRYAPTDVHEHVFVLGGDEAAVSRIVDLAESEGFVLTGWTVLDASIAGLLQRARTSRSP